MITVDEIAAQCDECGVHYLREDEDRLVVPWSSTDTATRFHLQVCVREPLVLLSADVFQARAAEEVEALSYVNYRWTVLGRWGVDLPDRRVRFEAELLEPSSGAVLAVIAKAAEAIFLGIDVVNRMRYAGVDAESALNGAIAALERRSALAEIEAVAADRWAGEAGRGAGDG